MSDERVAFHLAEAEPAGPRAAFGRLAAEHVQSAAGARMSLSLDMWRKRW